MSLAGTTVCLPFDRLVVLRSFGRTVARGLTVDVSDKSDSDEGGRSGMAGCSDLTIGLKLLRCISQFGRMPAPAAGFPARSTDCRRSEGPTGGEALAVSSQRV